MKYLLDTNILIYLVKKVPASASERFAQLSPGEAHISVVTWGELLFGANKSQRIEQNIRVFQSLRELIPVLPLPEEAGLHYGRIRAQLEQKGRRIGPNDLWIAAHALALDLTLVSNNTREFERVEGLKLENWG